MGRIDRRLRGEGCFKAQWAELLAAPWAGLLWGSVGRIALRIRGQDCSAELWAGSLGGRVGRDARGSRGRNPLRNAGLAWSEVQWPICLRDPVCRIGTDLVAAKRQYLVLCSAVTARTNQI